jgi:hypothetical protein
MPAVSAEVTQPLDAAEARALTDEVKRDAASLWAKLLALYEGGAHLALGYSSWGAYFKAEFGGAGSRGYHLLDAARVNLALVGSTTVEPPASERVARELAPLLDEPERLQEVWTEAVERHGPEATAAQVREVVRGVVEPEPEPEPEHDQQVFSAGTLALCPTCGGTGTVPVEAIGGVTR